MNNSQAERNAAIVRLHQSGALQISSHRVRQIIETAERQKKQWAKLEKKYGPNPNIPTLQDTTPIEVLLSTIM
jgi:hypothetical protein